MSFITKLYSTIIDGKACILFVNVYQKDKKKKKKKKQSIQVASFANSYFS